jgi:autotransporter-associated beta strand protein
VKSKCLLLWLIPSVVVALILGAAEVRAQTTPSTPPTKTAVVTSSFPVEWSTAANWSPAGVPTAADDVGIGLGGTVQIDEEDAVARTVTLGVLSVHGAYSPGVLDVFGDETLTITPPTGTENPGLQVLLGSTLQIEDGATVNLGAFAVDNFGTINIAPEQGEANPGILVAGTVKNETSGIITGGLSFANGGTVVNAGQISGASGFIDSGPTVTTPGILVTGGPGNITNSGNVSDGIELDNGGSVTNQAGGSITGIPGGDAAILSPMPFSGVTPTPLTVTNSGSISGSTGVEADTGGTVTNNAGGIIEGTNGPGIIASADDTGTPPPLTVVNSGTISGTTVGIELDGGGSITNNAGGSIVAGAGNPAVIAFEAAVTFSNAGQITGSVTLADFANAATLITGGTIAGDLDLGTNTGTTLTLDGTGSQLLSQAVTGTITNDGSVIKQGTGTWIIDKSLGDYGGGTTITAGTLQLGNGGTVGTINGNVADNGILAFDHSDVLTFAGAISGTGGVTQIGTGTTILLGDNTYSGGTTISAGTLEAGSSTSLSSNSDFTVNSILDLHGFTSTIGSLSGTGSVLNNGAVAATLTVGNDNASTTFGGVLENGTSVLQLIKSGTGTLTLTGANTYTGGTTIAAGTLQLGNGGTSGSVTGDVTDNGTLAFNRSDSVTFAGVVSGTGGVVKLGTGVLTLPGTETYNGPTTVNAGSLIVNGSIASAQTVVNSNGFLGGHGLIGGSLVNSGIVGQISSPGTLTVAGDYTQTGQGTLRIGVSGLAAGQSDLLAVDGHASVAGTLQFIRLGNFNLQPGDQITFLTANKGVSGTFDKVDNGIGGTGTIVQVEVISQTDSFVLEGTQGSFVQELNGLLTPNEGAVAKMLDSAAGDPRAAQLFQFLNSQPLANLPHDLSLIAPAQISSFHATGAAHGNTQIANLGGRMANIRAGLTGFSSIGLTLNGSPASSETGFAGVSGPEGKSGPSVLAPAPDNRWGVFVTGIGEFTDVDSTANAAGYDIDTGGVTFGVDYRVCPFLAIGLSAGYAHTRVNIDSGGGNLNVNSGKFGLYATAFAQGFYLDAAVTGGPSDYDSHRSALQGSANGSTNSGDVNALVAGGYDWKFGGLTIGPTASFQYGYTGLDSFTETGSLAPLKFPDQTAESERTAFGFKTTYDWKVGHIDLLPEFSAAWQHEYGDTEYSIVANLASGAGNSFTVTGPPVGRDSLLIGAGVAVLWTERISTYIYYDGEFARTNYLSNNVSAGVRVTF